MVKKLVLERACREHRGLTFDDVLLRVGYSEVLPAEVDISSRFSRNVPLKVPFVGAAMDTITESALAIALAMEGCIGIIHKNLAIEKQAKEVEIVKGYLSSVGVEGRPELFNVDDRDRLLVGAAVGVGEEAYTRAQRLIEAGVDVIVIDTAHGDSINVLDTLRRFKHGPDRFDIDVVAGNIAYGDAAKRLIDAGADGVKVGIGPGTICTTRVVAGVGEPQITAVFGSVRGAYEADDDVPICADGGIKYSGDVPKIIAAGAHCVMMGSVFAGTDETPGEIIEEEVEGKKVKYKVYRGMGSIEAMKEGRGARDRYSQPDVREEDLVAEGIEAKVPSKGPLAKIIHQYIGGLRKGMGYAGARTIDELREKGDFTEVTGAGARESHPSEHLHDVKESPNYRSQ